MKSSLVHWSLGMAATLAMFSACGVEGRQLTYEYHTLDAELPPSAAGNGGDAGDSNPTLNAGSGNSEGGEAGALGGAGSSSGGGNEGLAGSRGSSQAGSAGTAMGGTSGNAGSAGSNGSAGTGGSAAGGSAGQAVTELPCGDLNQDTVDDCSQTLVQNSRFDSASSGWDAEPLLTQVWDTSNASGKPGSGSLLLTNTAAVAQAVGSLMVGSRQCIATTAGTYDFAARVMLAPGEPAGQAGVNASLFDDDRCQGNVVAANTPISGGVAGNWTVLRGSLWLPPSVHSMYVRLVAIKPFVQSSLKVYVDDVLVAKH